jgi:hypothetical protein
MVQSETTVWMHSEDCYCIGFGNCIVEFVDLLKRMTWVGGCVYAAGGNNATCHVGGDFLQEILVRAVSAGKFCLGRVGCALVWSIWPKVKKSKTFKKFLTLEGPGSYNTPCTIVHPGSDSGMSSKGAFRFGDAHAWTWKTRHPPDTLTNINTTIQHDQPCTKRRVRIAKHKNNVAHKRFAHSFMLPAWATRQGNLWYQGERDDCKTVSVFDCFFSLMCGCSRAWGNMIEKIKPE